MLRVLVPSLLIIWTAVGVSTATGQNPAAPDTVLIDREFTDTLQTARATLFKNTVYQVDVSRPDARPRFSSVRSGVYPPTALRIRDSGGPNGGPVYEVHVDRDGEYDVGIRGTADGVLVRFRLHTDIRTTVNRQWKQDLPGWSIGLRAEVGHHSGYLTGATPDNPDAGMLYDGCVVISNGTFLNLCLGGGFDIRGGSKTKIAWIYTEVHTRLFALNQSGRLPTNLGVMVRVAQGGAGSAIPRDPSLFGIGGFVQQWISRSPNGRGLSALFTGYYGILRNIDTADGESMTVIKAAIQWLP